MKNIILIIITVSFISCGQKTTLDLTIIETETGIPVTDVQVDIIEVTFGGSLGNPSTSSEIIESRFTDENGGICFSTRENFDKIEIEITKNGFFSIIPDNDPRYDFFDLKEGDQVETTFEMDPEAILEFRIVDDPMLQEAGIVLRPGYEGIFELSFSKDTILTGNVRGNQIHDFRYKYYNTLGFSIDSIFVEGDQLNYVELLF